MTTHFERGTFNKYKALVFDCYGTLIVRDHFLSTATDLRHTDQPFLPMIVISHGDLTGLGNGHLRRP